MVSFLQVCETRSNIESCRESQSSHTIFIFWQINTDSDPVDKKTIPLWKWWCIVNETINTILIKNSKLKKRKFQSIGSSNDHFEKKIASLMRCIKEKKGWKKIIEKACNGDDRLAATIGYSHTFQPWRVWYREFYLV